MKMELIEDSKTSAIRTQTLGIYPKEIILHIEQGESLKSRRSVVFGTSLCIYTGLFETIVGVLTTCHTQYTSDSSICIFLFNRTTLPVFVTYRTGALYVHPL